MLTLKRSNLAAFITRERELLSVLWDALYLSPAQRLASFAPYAINVQPTLVWNEALGQEDEIINDNVSEELLVAHERERERLEAEVERSQPVLERLAKYFAVVDEMAQLEVGFAVWAHAVELCSFLFLRFRHRLLILLDCWANRHEAIQVDCYVKRRLGNECRRRSRSSKWSCDNSFHSGSMSKGDNLRSTGSGSWTNSRSEWAKKLQRRRARRSVEGHLDEGHSAFSN